MPLFNHNDPRNHLVSTKNGPAPKTLLYPIRNGSVRKIPLFVTTRQENAYFQITQQDPVTNSPEKKIDQLWKTPHFQPRAAPREKLLFPIKNSLSRKTPVFNKKRPGTKNNFSQNPTNGPARKVHFASTNRLVKEKDSFQFHQTSRHEKRLIPMKTSRHEEKNIYSHQAKQTVHHHELTPLPQFQRPNKTVGWYAWVRTPQVPPAGATVYP